jgi:hypothetical protein
MGSGAHRHDDDSSRLLRKLAVPVGAAIALLLAGQAIPAPSKARLPALSISTAAGDEGQTATLRVTLSRRAAKTVTVRYATVDGSALAGTDYTAASGMLVFKRGVRSKTIPVALMDDSEPEGAETFFVRLSRPRNARLGEAEGAVKIRASDLPPKFTIAAELRPIAGPATGRVTITLDPPTGAGTFTLELHGSPSDPVAAHIHSVSDAQLAIWLLPVPSRDGTSTGRVEMDVKKMVDIYRDPSNFDVQLHTQNEAFTLDGRLARVP